MKSEKEIRVKIQECMQDVLDFAKMQDVTPEDFFKVARQATYMTALYWALGEEVPKDVTALAVPIVKKMGNVQAEQAGKKGK